MEKVLTAYNTMYDAEVTIHDMKEDSLEAELGLNERQIYEVFDLANLASLPLIPGAHSAIYELKKHHDVVFLTNRKLVSPTLKMIDPDFPDITCLFAHRSARPKWRICKTESIDLLIDDEVKNLWGCRDNGVGYLLFDKPWNKYWDTEHRVLDWNQVLTKLI
jgi:5'(3')-deoxyribonucleotidase